ncbi:MAG TPA: thermonuclease family protein, partial [Sumerlaeia bacterium]|nr:thermonuclease family protein [Sumerlaeia bacterium]
YGTKAKQFTVNAAFGKTVTVKVRDKDRWGRTVGELTLPDGRNLNRELVREGLAWWYSAYAPGDKTLRTLDSAARAERRGLWADAEPIPPWEFRRDGDRGAESPEQPPPQTTATLTAISTTMTQRVEEPPLAGKEKIAWLLSQTIANSGKQTFVTADFVRDAVAYEELCRLAPENPDFQAGLQRARATLEKIARAEAEGGWVSEDGPATNYVSGRDAGKTHIDWDQLVTDVFPSLGSGKKGHVNIPKRTERPKEKKATPIPKAGTLEVRMARIETETNPFIGGCNAFIEVKNASNLVIQSLSLNVNFYGFGKKLLAQGRLYIRDLPPGGKQIEKENVGVALPVQIEDWEAQIDSLYLPGFESGKLLFDVKKAR